MERIIRLNAVETSSQGGNFGMKLYDFHPQNHLTPKKVSVDSSVVYIAAATVLETSTSDRHARGLGVGKALRWGSAMQLVKNMFALLPT
ncbi:hypothetical protein H6G41_22765 [Tolypothrix sp. FACHB-123]|uniref:hypothetical protein n=1 Tax=Tolypothrix sp. FACHB-123 TaxID=2692868 RepID=UPI001689444E|nr:hypothetical protein [Tolypothrix sp. FACHB-123]MBD2357405.1 hypothetical protein [Tolypothrix sp. FACHB-123]